MIKKTSSYREISLIVIFLIVFLFIHADLLFLNRYRCNFDTLASYSEFYYALNSFRNGNLPLWDPYTHAGQPFYYHFVKIIGAELSIIFFSLISFLFKISIFTLYHYQITVHFLIFILGCFYLSRVLFSRKIISYYILLLGLFHSQYGSILGQPGSLMSIEFLPWLIAFFILFVTGKACSYHLFASVLSFLFCIQSTEFHIPFYFLLLFGALYCIFFRKQLSLSKMPLRAWVFAAFVLFLGTLKTLVLLSEINNIFPSLRVFATPVRIGSGINIASHLGQIVPIRIRDYLNLLNPLIGRYGGSEMKFYLGFIPTFFAFYAMFASRSRAKWAFIIPGVLSLWISLGRKAFLSSICFYVLPFFKSIRIMELFSGPTVYISLVFISAFGFEAILEKLDLSKDLRKFWKYIQKYLWLFIILGFIITSSYIYIDNNDIIKSLLVLSYSLIPLIGIALYYISNILGTFLKINDSVKRIIILLAAILILIIALVILSQPFFLERLKYFNLSRLIMILIVFCIIIGHFLYPYNKRRSSIIAIICLGVTFIDLVLFTGLSTYTRVEKREDLVLPERTKLFEYQNFRQESYWPSNIGEVYALRPAMLYLQSSVITEEKFYRQGSLISTKNRDYDFYMLRKFYDAYRRFPVRIKSVIMGVDMPKLVFFTDYKQMDDEAVFKECEKIDPNLLKRFIYIAPGNSGNLKGQKFSKGQASVENIKVEYFDNNRLKLSIDAEEEGFLYYSDGYDRNWRCLVDGKQQPIQRANIAFKAIFIPEGRHSVLFKYEPSFYIISFWLFLSACLICIFSIGWSWVRRNR